MPASEANAIARKMGTCVSLFHHGCDKCADYRKQLVDGGRDEWGFIPGAHGASRIAAEATE